MPQHVRLQSAHLAIWIVVALSLGAGGAAARTWRVAKDGSGEFSVIQDAVNAAADGDTIFIAAGRYPERTMTLAWGQPPREACVIVTVDNLTFIGESAQEVTVGPETYVYSNYGPVGFGCTTESVTSIRLQDIGLVNNYYHLYKRTGTVEMQNCHIKGGATGIAFFEGQSSLVEGCLVEDCRSGMWFSGCTNVTVRGSEFQRAAGPGYRAVYMQGCDRALVADCRIGEGGTGIGYDLSTGEILRCRITGPRAYYGIVVFGTSNVLVADCFVSGGAGGLRASSDAVVNAVRSVFRGTGATLGVVGSVVTMRDCHIENAGGWSVDVTDDSRYSTGDYDLVGNWWGTTDADQIEAWIKDANDDPQIGTVVQYVPFLDHPVGTENKTLGGIKGMFR